MVGTGNFTKSSMTKNREFFVFSSDFDTKNYLERVFEMDFYHREISSAAFTGMILAPVNTRSSIENLINHAKKEIFFYTESLSDEKIFTLLKKRREQGIRIFLCTEKPLAKKYIEESS